jgi:hypothetical protein
MRREIRKERPIFSLKIFKNGPKRQEMINALRENNSGEIHEPMDLPTNRRRHPRAIFIYPVTFELFSITKEPSFYNGYGYLKDISLGGAGLQFEDKYGRFMINEQENGIITFKDKYGRFEFSEEEKIKVNLLLSLSREEKANLFAPVRWIKKIESNSYVRMGIEFKDLEEKQSEAVKKLIGFKNKEHHMMWTLWEQYQDHNFMWTLWE